ncbi:DUF1643 domain-containing protein [Listeria monocytogenes]|uniref:DUF1643 domain-containing protein n=1 Tax=Listeria monocytogenes TaxID=1639 RepID=UPI001EDD8FE1|nr:DUF1643 domain-containing protein [Listeria monocytogenes]MCG3315199.1 DUF1643 domain-containing protein [Listeria monocytogenes]MCH5071783.1 DUF1643 domain-containing protein [Listeria monocytogenes]
MSEIVERKIAVEFEENRKYRYSWSISYESDSSLPHDLLVIMMNPSKADESGPDRTIKKIMDWNKDKRLCENSSYKSIIIMNISPLVETDSKKALNVFIKNEIPCDILKGNLSKLACEISEVKNIIIAWGIIGDKIFREVLEKYPNNEQVKCLVSALKEKVSARYVKCLEMNETTTTFRHPRRAWEDDKKENFIKTVEQEDFPALYGDQK